MENQTGKRLIIEKIDWRLMCGHTVWVKRVEGVLKGTILECKTVQNQLALRYSLNLHPDRSFDCLSGSAGGFTHFEPCNWSTVVLKKGVELPSGLIAHFKSDLYYSVKFIEKDSDRVWGWDVSLQTSKVCIAAFTAPHLTLLTPPDAYKPEKVENGVTLTNGDKEVGFVEGATIEEVKKVVGKLMADVAENATTEETVAHSRPYPIYADEATTIRESQTVAKMETVHPFLGKRVAHPKLLPKGGVIEQVHIVAGGFHFWFSDTLWHPSEGFELVQESPEVDYSTWVGRLCVVAIDSDRAHKGYKFRPKSFHKKTRKFIDSDNPNWNGIAFECVELVPMRPMNQWEALEYFLSLSSPVLVIDLDETGEIYGFPYFSNNFKIWVDPNILSYATLSSYNPSDGDPAKCKGWKLLEVPEEGE